MLHDVDSASDTCECWALNQCVITGMATIDGRCMCARSDMKNELVVQIRKKLLWYLQSIPTLTLLIILVKDSSSEFQGHLMSAFRIIASLR